MPDQNHKEDKLTREAREIAERHGVKMYEPLVADELYYVQNRGCCGNSARWWCVDGHGYTSDLNKAWRVPKAKAESICSDRPEEDFPRLCSEMDAIAERHIDVQKIGGMRV